MVIPVDTSLAGYVIEHGNAIRYDNFNQIPRIFGETSGLNSVMAAPIRSHNEILGVLMVQSDQVGYFTLSDEKLLIVLAGQLFSIIMNKEVNLESRVYARNLDLIHQVVQQIVG
jgi:GAF domain-containing protein